MDHDGRALHSVKLRAFDLSEHALRRGRTSVAERLDRWRGRAFMITQCSVTAGLSWWLAKVLFGHPQPFFAAVASIITLGISFGSRLRRAVEVAIGVALGVGIGDLWVSHFGNGVWQIIVVCAIAMSVATLVGAGQLMIIQAGVQSIIVIALAPNLGYGLNRWLDAVLGCVLALAVATVAPSSPLRKPGLVAAEVLRGMADTLTAAAAALRLMDVKAADAVLEQARAGEAGLASFDQAAAEGVAVVRQSPFRRRQLGKISALADLYGPLDHANRNLRVLARRCVIAVWRGHPVPTAYVDLMERLVGICRFMADELEAQRFPTLAQPDLRALAKDTGQVEVTLSLSATVILAQVRSMITDLMELAGLDYTQARDLLPDLD